MRTTMHCLIAALALSTVAGVALAQESQPAPQEPTVESTDPGDWGPNFVDEDGDGVCDYWTEGRRGYGNGYRRGQGQGPAFVDEDGDGVCDDRTQGRRGRRGRGNGQGRWQGRQAPASE